MSRVLRVAQIQLTSGRGAFGWPLTILGISFAVNLAFFAAMGDRLPNQPDAHITGGLGSIYILQLIAAWQSMNQMFSFAVGLNVTRRTFYAGTLLVTTGLSLVFGGLLYLFELLEHASGGWGIDLPFFDPLPATHGNSPLNILVYAVPMLMLSSVGLFLGIVTKRWGVNGFFGLTVLSLVLTGLLGVLASWLHGWSAIGSWLTGQSAVGLLVGWLLVPATLLVAGGYGLLRRAIP
jgi:hypothetical protein